MFFAAISLAWREIRHNPMRSGLTTLGIVIGVAAVIILVTLGNGASASITNQIKGLGSNLLLVFPGQIGRGGPQMQPPPFKMEDVQAIEKHVRGLSSISATTVASKNAVYRNRNHTTQVQGTGSSYLAVTNTTLSAGRAFSPAEERAGQAVCILGETVRENLFGGQTPIGATIRLGQVPCKVIGALEGKGGGSFGSDQDDVILAPIRMVQRRLTGTRNVNVIYLAAASEQDSGRVANDVEALLRVRRDLASQQENDFTISDSKQLTSIVESTIGQLTVFIALIAAVSLLVGGIGIMNIMLVSVTERTREIGIRLAIGALERDVLVQFLIEAAALSLLGGLAGVALGLGISAAIGGLLGFPFVIDWAVVALALGISAAIGIIFGFFPARRAARFDPIEALRYE